MAAGAFPERARAALRAAFAGEVATRLPGMRSACAEVVATGAVEAARSLVAHAHTLASSAAVLGESLASRHARRCERLLAGWCDGEAPAVPPDVAADAAGEVEAVSLLLAPWLAGAA